MYAPKISSLPRNYTRTVLPTYTCTCGTALDVTSATNGYSTTLGTTQTSRLFVQCPMCSATYVREESFIPLFPSQLGSEPGAISSPPPPPPPNSPDFWSNTIPEISSCDTIPLCHSPKSTSPTKSEEEWKNISFLTRPEYWQPSEIPSFHAKWTGPFAPYQCTCGEDLEQVKQVGRYRSEGLYTCRTCGLRMYYSKPSKQHT